MTSPTEMIDEKALQAACKAKHEKYRKARSVEMVAWEQLLPVFVEAAMDEARLIVEAYLAAMPPVQEVSDKEAEAAIDTGLCKAGLLIGDWQREKGMMMDPDERLRIQR